MLGLTGLTGDLTLGGSTSATLGSTGDILTGAGCCGAWIFCGHPGGEVGTCACCDPDWQDFGTKDQKQGPDAETCVNSGTNLCCKVGQPAGTFNCCEVGETVTPEGTCCPADTTGCRGACCKDGETCATQCLGMTCAEVSGVCCAAGTTHCGKGSNCCNNKTEQCNSAGDFGFGECCDKDVVVCSGVCCDADEHCDLTTGCAAGTPVPEP